MFEPKYIITNDLLVNIKRIATLTVELNHRSFSEVVLVELAKRALTLSAHTSTRIEGNPLPLTEVKKLLRSIPENLRDSEQEVINYNQALKELNQMLSKEIPPLTLNRILQIHKTVMKGLFEPYYCGRLRNEPVVVNNPLTGETIYLPPDHADVRPLMKDLVSFTNRNKNKLDPLIIAGIFHKQFIIIHPFTDGNGRSARLATKVLLAAMGINTFPLFSFENYYNKNISRYFKEVGVIGNYYDANDTIDFTDWLVYFTGGIIDELLRITGELELKSSSPETTLQLHHKTILEVIHANGFIMDRDYAKLTERAKATRALDFKKMIELGIIERHGKGKNIHYKIKE